MIIMGFFNFGNDDKKDVAVNTSADKPQLDQYLAPGESPFYEGNRLLKIIPMEKGVVHPAERDSANMRSIRSNAISRTFGTSDVDFALRAYAPETMEEFDAIYDRQQNFYNWTKEHLNEQDEKIEALNKKIDMLLNMLNEKQQNNNFAR